MTSAMAAASLVGISVILLLAGGGLVVWLALRPRSTTARARRILSQRFARGEIPPDDYRDRLTTLDASSSWRRSRALPVALSLIAVGIAGTVVSGVWAANSSWGWMDDVMDGDMRSMMPMMQSGSTEGGGDPFEPGMATTEVVSREFSFAPAEIALREGETVNIELANEGHMFHTLTVPDLDFELRAQSGDSAVGALTAREPGTYEFICAVPRHDDMGMRGRIVVAAS